MAHVGYIRVSSGGQNAGCQLDGIALDKLFEDKAGSGDAGRPALSECRDFLREGDILHIQSLDRPARNMADLHKLVVDCVNRGVEVRFHKENLTFSACGNEKPDQGRTIMLHMLEAFADFEKALLMERQREGRAAAAKKGKIFGRPPAITSEKVEEIWSKLQAGRLAADIARECGVCRSSVYNIRRKKLNEGKT